MATSARDTSSSEAVLRWQLAILRELGHELVSGATYLDFGCADGGGVYVAQAAGFDAFGCDIVMESPTDRLRLITEPYRLPFPDNMFDFVGSSVVFEHVQNPGEALREIHRVLKSGGTSLHLFPARWLLIEPHTYVPLGTLVRSLPWLRLWASLGVRNEFQDGKPPAEVARLNHRYLRDNTNYLTRRQIKRHAESVFPRVVFAERAAIVTGPGRLASIAPLARRAPIIARLYSGLRDRVIFVEKTSA